VLFCTATSVAHQGLLDAAKTHCWAVLGGYKKRAAETGIELPDFVAFERLIEGLESL